MARRKDHTREELKNLILAAADTIIAVEGSGGLTARALSAHIGYSPGTIYNVYQDMAALRDDMNFITLGRLEENCRAALSKAGPNDKHVPILAYAYLDFARTHSVRWKMIFEQPRHAQDIRKLPDAYVQRLNTMFTMIENALIHDHNHVNEDARVSARLLWASFHGITTLILDGRLSMLGLSDHDNMIKQLIQKFSGH